MAQNLSESTFQPTILMDERERGTIRTYFESLPCHLRILTMDVGDYVVSAEIGIERKRGDDFTASLLDNRLFGQLKNLKEIFMLTAEKTLKISSKGQITLPRKFRELLASDIVRIVADQGTIKIEPVADAAGSLRRYAGRYDPLKQIRDKVWEEALGEKHLRG